MTHPLPLIRRDTLVDQDLQPGEYRQPPGGDLAPWAIVRCPKCQGASAIGRRVHQVDAMGAVAPAATCPHGCGWTAKVVMDGWVPESEGDA